MDGCVSVAPSALTCTRRSTPTSLQISASRDGKSTCTASNEKFRVSHSRPTMFTTTFDRATAYLIASSSLTENPSKLTICPKSPITFKCCRAFSLHREGRIIREPDFAMWFTTYRPRKPVAPKTVDVMPLRLGERGEDGERIARKRAPKGTVPFVPELTRDSRLGLPSRARDGRGRRT